MWRPLLQFTLLGALLFAADRAFLSEPPRPDPVVVSGERFDALREQAERFGLDERGLAELIRTEVDEELLVRRAREQGLDRDDPVVIQRLVQNLRFAGADPDKDDLTIYREALALGLDRSDPVVRRRLVQVMRLEIEAAAQGPEPSEAELRARYETDATRAEQPARTRFAQLFFARGHEERAREALARLRAAQAGPDADGEGEPFLHARVQPAQADAELSARFGHELAEGLAALPQGSWQGPVPSAYGQHLVYVEERIPAGRAPFESVREPLRLSLLAERRARALESELARMREGVEILLPPSTPAGSRAGG